MNSFGEGEGRAGEGVGGVEAQQQGRQKVHFKCNTLSQRDEYLGSSSLCCESCLIYYNYGKSEGRHRVMSRGNSP